MESSAEWIDSDEEGESEVKEEESSSSYEQSRQSIKEREGFRKHEEKFVELKFSAVNEEGQPIVLVERLPVLSENVTFGRKVIQENKLQTTVTSEGTERESVNLIDAEIEVSIVKKMLKMTRVNEDGKKVEEIVYLIEEVPVEESEVLPLYGIKPLVSRKLVRSVVRDNGKESEEEISFLSASEEEEEVKTGLEDTKSTQEDENENDAWKYEEEESDSDTRETGSGYKDKEGDTWESMEEMEKEESESSSEIEYEEGSEKPVGKREILLEKIKMLYEENNELTERNQELCKRVDQQLHASKDKQGKEQPMENMKELEDKYEELLMEFRKLKLLAGVKRYEMETDLNDIFKKNKEAQQKVQKAVSHLANLEKSIAQKIGPAARPFLKSHETVEGLIAQQLSISDRLSSLRWAFIKACRTNEELRAEKQLQETKCSESGVDLLEYERLKAETQSLFDKLDAKKASIVKMKERMISNAQTLAHIREKYGSYKQDFLKELHKKEETHKELVQVRSKLKKTGDMIRNIREETKKMNTKAGLLLYPKLLLDHQHIEENIKKLREELDAAQQEYDMKKKILERTIRTQLKKDKFKE